MLGARKPCEQDDVGDLTVLIPFLEGSREDWLQQAMASVPPGIPSLVLKNDGELADALNKGLAQADTEYVLRLDADDTLHAPSVQMLLDACWDVDVSYPDVALMREDMTQVGSVETGDFCPHRILTESYIPGAGCVMRRQAVLDVGGYRDLVSWEDWDLWVRMVRAGKKFKAHRDAMYVHRLSEGRRSIVAPDAQQELRDLIVGDEPELLATFYTQETAATTYWRCQLPARFLPGQSIIHRPMMGMDGDRVVFPNHRGGTAIWQFPGNKYERYAMAAMQEMGVRVLIESDDNYLERIPYGNIWQRGMQTHDHEKPSVELHKRIAKWVDGVTVTTEHLAKIYRKYTDAPVFVCPNQIDPADWPEPDAVVLPDWYDPNLTYVGAALSGSHGRDLPLIGRALEWAAKQKQVEVVMIGLDPAIFKGRFKYRHIPWTTDLSAYRMIQNVLDVGLCPIVPNAWAVCRSDLKPLEMLMSGAVPVLSDEIPYVGWTDGEGCRKAKEPRDFLRAVQELVNSPERRQELARAGRELVLAERTVAGNIDRWREALETNVEAVAA